jgi:hypothetical protein
MATIELSLQQVNTLPLVRVSEYEQIEAAMDRAENTYRDARIIESEAWQMFYEGIDAGYTAEAVTDLRLHAEYAEQLRIQAYRDLDAAKTMILALRS